jgi:hypothetical protein
LSWNTPEEQSQISREQPPNLPYDARIGSALTSDVMPFVCEIADDAKIAHPESFIV